MLTTNIPQGYAILTAGPMAQSFRNVAHDLVEKFHTGVFTFRKPLEFYNTATGQVEVTYSATTVVKAVDDEIKSKLYGNITKGSILVITSGLHLGEFIPEVGDMIIFPDGIEHRIVEEYHDAYFARFEMGVEKWRG